MTSITLRNVKKCATEVHLKVFGESRKLSQMRPLLYEFPEEENVCQSFSVLFKEFYSMDFDAKGIK